MTMRSEDLEKFLSVFSLQVFVRPWEIDFGFYSQQISSANMFRSKYWKNRGGSYSPSGCSANISTAGYEQCSKDFRYRSLNVSKFNNTVPSVYTYSLHFV